MVLFLLRLLAAMAIAFIMGKLVAKLKLPSILGWLIAGIALGPHALSLMGLFIIQWQRGTTQCRTPCRTKENNVRKPFRAFFLVQHMTVRYNEDTERSGTQCFRDGL